MTDLIGVGNIFIIVVISIFSAVFLYLGVPWIWGRYNRALLKRKAVRSNAFVLTLDDGPGNRLTPAILEILKEYNAKATFFLLGRNIEGREEIVGQIAAGGHEICSHGFDHLNQWKVSPLRAICDIKRGWQAIDRVLNVKKQVYPFRPPGGKLNIVCLLYLWSKRIPIYYWTVVSSDTWPIDKRDSKRAALLAGKMGGAVVLAHDFDRTTDHIDSMVLETVRLTLLAARNAGMRVVTFSEFISTEWEN